MHARTTEDVGSLVREHRVARAMSQAALAQAVGASRQWVVDLERGKPTLALGLVLRALTAVGLTLRVDAPGATLEGAHGAVDLDTIIARARAPGASANTAKRAITARKSAARSSPKPRGKKRT